jgi:hypothetical protein
MLAYLNGLIETTGVINEIDAIRTEIERIEAALAIVQSARYTLIAQASLSADFLGDTPTALGYEPINGIPESGHS